MTTSMTFAQFGLSEPLLRAITELGYEEHTPIQERAIMALINGQDVIAQAQTGTGKTAAFALPIIEKLDPDVQTPQALVLTPTRELAVQVAEAFHSYTKYQQISVLPIYGGQPIERQLGALKRGVQVVVGTPGRVLDHIRRGTLKLGQLKTLALDEADEMLAMGFIEDIETILQETPETRQTALFSATMPRPIAELAQRYMRNAQRITVKAEQMTVSQIRQVYYEVGRRDKFEVLVRILDYERPTAAIIFCRTKLEVDSLGERLIARAYPAETLHGDLNQTQRDRVLGRFRSEQVELLIATDVAARGLDIEHVTHVINYDIPLDPESYVHRIGRTGRAGRTGMAITLLTPRERRLWQVIGRVTGAQVQRLRLPTVSDVFERRREVFMETIRETLSQEEGLEPYTIMAEELGDEYSPTDVAAAAFKLLLGAPPAAGEDKLAEAEEEEEDRRPRGAAAPAGRRRDGARQFGPESGMTRIYLSVGREDGVRPGDIVGAIANEAGITGRAIGAIELYDRFSMVDVPSNQAREIVETLNKNQTQIRNHKLDASLARPATDRPRSNDRPASDRPRSSDRPTSDRPRSADRADKPRSSDRPRPARSKDGPPSRAASKDSDRPKRKRSAKE